MVNSIDLRVGTESVLSEKPVIQFLTLLRCSKIIIFK